MTKNYKNMAAIITISLFLAVIMLTTPALAEEDEDLEWRMELIRPPGQ